MYTYCTHARARATNTLWCVVIYDYSGLRSDPVNCIRPPPQIVYVRKYDTVRRRRTYNALCTALARSRVFRKQILRVSRRHKWIVCHRNRMGPEEFLANDSRGPFEFNLEFAAATTCTGLCWLDIVPVNRLKCTRNESTKRFFDFRIVSSNIQPANVYERSNYQTSQSDYDGCCDILTIVCSVSHSYLLYSNDNFY